VVLGYAQNWLDAEDGATDTDGTFLVGGFYDFRTGTRLRGSVARKIRFPSLRQLYEIDNGNPDLDSESSYNFEVGIEQDLPWQTQLALTGFQMELYDFIERIGDQPFENRERLRMRGFEVTAASQPWEPLFFRLGYTFLDARDIDDDSPFDELQSRPRHKLDAEARYTFPWGTVGRIAVSYVVDTFVYTRNEPFLQGELDNFTLVDFKLTQPLWEGRLNLYAGVDNLLDEDWTLNYGFPQAGRTIYGGAELRF
jgi:outer membrane cobalamin receptor